MQNVFADNDFHRLERGGESKPYILEEGKLQIGAGTHLFEVVNTERDLDPEDRGRLHANIGALLITPEAFDIHGNRGFKALRESEVVEVGRDAAGRFMTLPDDRRVSRSHFDVLFRSGNVMVRDRRSTNGTWVKWHDLSKQSQLSPEIEAAHKTGGESIASDKHPAFNQDAWFVDGNMGTIGVFDGMGSHSDSGQASAIASRVSREALSAFPADLPISLAKLRMEEIMVDCHREIVDSYIEGGTTATIGRVYESEEGVKTAVIGSVGDSRAYLFRDGALRTLTLDHAYSFGLSLEDKWEAQHTLSQAKALESLSGQQKHMFMNRNIIESALGMDADRPSAISVDAVEVLSGDRLIFTSDGVHDNLTTDEIAEICQANVHHTPQELAQWLAHSAAKISRQGEMRSKADDITAAILEV